MKVTDAIRAAVLALVVSAPAFSQPLVPPYAQTVDLAGPRFGTTFLSGGVVKKLTTSTGIEISPFVTQFGWQLEKQFYAPKNGPTALTEGVVLLGGLEQGLVIPSLSWLVGLRTREWAEFAIGPNVSPAGVALALVAGTTFRAGDGVMRLAVSLSTSLPSRVSTLNAKRANAAKNSS
jgi:hypothetical protein